MKCNGSTCVHSLTNSTVSVGTTSIGSFCCRQLYNRYLIRSNLLEMIIIQKKTSQTRLQSHAQEGRMRVWERDYTTTIISTTILLLLYHLSYTLERDTVYSSCCFSSFSLHTSPSTSCSCC